MFSSMMYFFSSTRASFQSVGFVRVQQKSHVPVLLLQLLFCLSLLKLGLYGVVWKDAVFFLRDIGGRGGREKYVGMEWGDDVVVSKGCTGRWDERKCETEAAQYCEAAGGRVREKREREMLRVYCRNWCDDVNKGKQRRIKKSNIVRGRDRYDKSRFVYRKKTIF